MTQCIEEAEPTQPKITRKLINKIEIANDCGKIINFAVWEFALFLLESRRRMDSSDFTMLKFLANIIQLILSPAQGWEDLAEDDRMADGRRGDINIRRLYFSCFIPLIAFVAATSFVKMIYDGGPTFLEALQTSIIEFFSLFLSYHLAVYAFSWAVPRLVPQEEKADNRRCAIMILYCISVIALIFMLGNLIKVSLALIQFLPLYVLFILWKGAGYVGVTEKNIGLFMIMASMAVLGSVYGLSFIFNILM